MIHLYIQDIGIGIDIAGSGLDDLVILIVVNIHIILHIGKQRSNREDPLEHNILKHRIITQQLLLLDCPAHYTLDSLY
jgi:hypothetical protein